MVGTVKSTKEKDEVPMSLLAAVVFNSSSASSNDKSSHIEVSLTPKSLYKKKLKGCKNTCYIVLQNGFNFLCRQRALDILNINIERTQKYFHVTCG